MVVGFIPYPIPHNPDYAQLFKSLSIVAALHYFFHILHYHFPTLLLIPLFIGLRWRKDLAIFAGETRRSFRLLLMIIAAICLVVPALRNDNLWSGYMMACIPLALIGAAWVMHALGLIFPRWVMLTAIVLFLSSSALNLPYWPLKGSLNKDGSNMESVSQSVLQRRWRALGRQMIQREIATPLYDYGIELTTPYAGPVEGIVEFLKTQGKSSDSFFATNDVNTLQFVTGMHAVQDLPFEEPPTWIIRRGNSSWGNALCSSQGLDANEYVSQYLQTHRYEAIQLDYPDLYHENEPVLPYHHWTTLEGKRRVVLFKYAPLTR